MCAPAGCSLHKQKHLLKTSSRGPTIQPFRCRLLCTAQHRVTGPTGVRAAGHGVIRAMGQPNVFDLGRVGPGILQRRGLLRRDKVLHCRQSAKHQDVELRHRLRQHYVFQGQHSTSRRRNCHERRAIRSGDIEQVPILRHLGNRIWPGSHDEVPQLRR